MAERGWSKEAQESARWALSALSGHKPEVPVVHLGEHKHIMMSYAWEFQEMVTRVVEALKRRGYNVWFGKLRHRPVWLCILRSLASTDLERMKGSVIDAMSEAVEGAVSDFLHACLFGATNSMVQVACGGAGGDALRSLGALQGVGELPDGGSVRDAAA